MTIEQHIAKLQKQRDKLLSVKDKALKMAAFDTNKRVAKRIFTGGGAQNGKIGQYSTKQSLATRDQFTKKSAFKQSKAQGFAYASSIKTKKTKAIRATSLDKPLWIKFKKAKKAVPVMILENGYKQLRSIQGKPSGTVNLDYSASLMKDFSNSIQAHKRGYAAIVKQDRSAKIIEWMELKYKKKIFALSKYELQIFKKTLNDEFIRWTSKP